MAYNLALFGVVVGIALLLSGIGFIILAILALGRTGRPRTDGDAKGARSPKRPQRAELSSRDLAGHREGAARAAPSRPRQRWGLRARRQRRAPREARRNSATLSRLASPSAAYDGITEPGRTQVGQRSRFTCAARVVGFGARTRQIRRRAALHTAARISVAGEAAGDRDDLRAGERRSGQPLGLCPAGDRGPARCLRLARRDRLLRQLQRPSGRARPGLSDQVRDEILDLQRGEPARRLHHAADVARRRVRAGHEDRLGDVGSERLAGVGCMGLQRRERQLRPGGRLGRIRARRMAAGASTRPDVDGPPTVRAPRRGGTGHPAARSDERPCEQGGQTRATALRTITVNRS